MKSKMLGPRNVKVDGNELIDSAWYYKIGNKISLHIAFRNDYMTRVTLEGGSFFAVPLKLKQIDLDFKL